MTAKKQSSSSPTGHRLHFPLSATISPARDSNVIGQLLPRGPEQVYYTAYVTGRDTGGMHQDVCVRG